MASKSDVSSLVKKPSKEVDAVIIGLAEAAQGPVLVGAAEALASTVSKTIGQPLLAAAQQLGAKTSVGSVAIVPHPDYLIAVVGIGDIDAMEETLRRAVGSAVRRVLQVRKADSVVAVSLDTEVPEQVKALVEGALLGGHTSPTYKTSDLPPIVTRVEVVSPSSKSAMKRAVELGGIVSAAVCQARDWVNEPPNHLYPDSFATKIRDAAKGSKIEVEVLDEKSLAKQGYGGLMAVGGGSDRPPRLVRLTYRPRGAKFHLGLVGKGITFDSGGLDLKPAASMQAMKCDMGGAAAVVSALTAIAELGLPLNVTCYAALAENLPSATAYRPSDVITIYGGTTVENKNTDAEGRLVMADALARLSQDQPDMIVDAATLTGACMVALGQRYAGLMASDDTTADTVLDAADAAGELFWQLPIPQYIDDELTGDIADVNSLGKSDGKALAAAAFLRRFVPKDLPWAHLDIAGPAFNSSSAYDYVPEGGTGMSVRTLVALATSLRG